MSIRAFSASIGLVGLLAACANSGANYSPVVDGPKGPNYQSDLAACQSLAASQPQADGGTAASAAAGAGMAALWAAVFDNSNVGEAAAVGAAGGVLSDQVGKTNNRQQIVKNCMRGRGHNVVG